MRRWVVLVAIVLPAGAAVVATSAAGRSSVGLRFPGGPQGVFTAVCGFTHRNQDDAIVYPNQPGRSHDHTYFGNATANAASTPESLLAAKETTCSFLGDTAAYWVPTLLVEGRAVEPVGAHALYVKGTFGHITPFPFGLKVIAGDALAREPQSQRVVGWNCTAPGAVQSSAIPVCPPHSDLILRVTFPNCWNGRDLDNPDHKSHMAYSVDRVCPATHSVAVPELQLVVRYEIDGGALELSSGGTFSAHADFVNSWDQKLLTKWVNIYLNRKRGG